METIDQQPSNSPAIVHQLSDLLLHALGKTALISEWRHVLQPLGQLEGSVLEGMHHVQASGLLLCMVDMDTEFAQAAANDPVLGLQSAQFMARSEAGGAPWAHEWPFDLQAADLSKTTVLKTLGAPVINQKTFSLFEYKPQKSDKAKDTGKATGATNTQSSIGVQCEWGMTQQLVRLTMQRLQAFEVLAPIEFAMPVPVPTRQAPSPPAPTCRAGEPAPEAGVYEAKLPSDHPDARYYNTSPMRFALGKKGHPMTRLGVVPREDEALVVWTWIRAS